MSVMTCDEIRKAMAEFNACEHTAEGARIATHCLYPSFEYVRVFVVKVGDGFHVHDGAGAYNAAWLHGRDDEMIKRSLDDAAERFRLHVSGTALVGNVKSLDWLTSAILSVANASSIAAHDAVAKIAAAQEEALVNRIAKSLAEAVGPRYIKELSRNVNIRGFSGGLRHFDFVLGREGSKKILINSVTPHRNSISAKYVSFADTEGDPKDKFAVHDRDLDNDDTLLLQQVASVVPLTSLVAGTQRYLKHGLI